MGGDVDSIKMGGERVKGASIAACGMPWLFPEAFAGAFDSAHFHCGGEKRVFYPRMV
jgi:hypothetical protein